MKRFNLFICGLSLVFASCVKNQSVTYPNFDYTTAYFATQYPVRTVELGEDLFVDNSLDNERKINIQATIGGVRDNKNQVTLGFTVVDSLCNNLYFSDNGLKIVPMPSSYYKLESNSISIPSGSILGGVHVQLTDAFFADPLSLQNTYAIPLVLTQAVGVDSILKGNTPVENPDRRLGSDWTVLPKDFVLYVVKFVNDWHGNYLRRGKDIIKYAGETQTNDVIRHAQFVEQDEVNSLSTKALKEVNFPVIFKDKSGVNVTCTLVLKFDSEGKCTISSGTDGATATGSGVFVKKGDKKSWGNVDRDALYLNYEVSMAQLTSKTTDTLVMRDRGVGPEYFTPIIK